MLTRSSQPMMIGQPKVAMPPRRRHGAWSKLVLGLGSLVAMLVCLELGFRGYDSFFQGLPFCWDPASSAKKSTELYNPFLLFRGPWHEWTTRAKASEQV